MLLEVGIERHRDVADEQPSELCDADAVVVELHEAVLREWLEALERAAVGRAERLRAAVGVDANGASVSDPKDISTYAHMFGCWETLHIVKAGMEAAGYAGPGDRAKLIEAVEAMTDMPHSQAHPQGAKRFNGKTHQVFGHQYISKVTGGKLMLQHTTSIEDTLYPDEVDYTAQPL